MMITMQTKHTITVGGSEAWGESALQVRRQALPSVCEGRGCARRESEGTGGQEMAPGHNNIAYAIDGSNESFVVT